MKSSHTTGVDPPPRMSYGSVSVLPDNRQRRGRPSGFVGTCKGVVFLFLQTLLSWGFGMLLLAWVLLSVVLLPLCGIGLFTFDLLFTLGLVAYAAECDVTLTNYVAPAHDQIQTSEASDCDGLLHDWDQPPERLLTGLARVSVESTTVLAYLVSIKLFLASAGVALLFILVMLPLTMVRSLLGSDAMADRDPSTSAWVRVCAYASVMLVLVVALLCVDVLVGICAATTRFFCCERVYRLPLPRPGGCAAPRIVVVRLPSSSRPAAFVATTQSSSASSADATSVAA